MDNLSRSTLPIRIASYTLAAVALLLVMALRLLPALLAGLLVYEVVFSTAPLLGNRLAGTRARALVVAILAVVVVGLLRQDSWCFVGLVSSLAAVDAQKGR